jgi:hypothetical protein
MYTACLLLACAADPAPARPTDREALKPFNGLVGSWRGTGYPEDRSKGLWTETVTWSWKFKDGKATVTATFDKGKHFRSAVLEYLPDTDRFRMTLTTPEKTTVAFEGTFKDKALTLDRTDTDAKEDQRLVVTLLHADRFLYRYETRPAGTELFTRRFLVGANREGVAFADVPKGPECIVSGGLGTMKLTYKGKEYFVCCSGCRDAFLEDPEKYVREAAARQKAGGK